MFFLTKACHSTIKCLIFRELRFKRTNKSQIPIEIAIKSFFDQTDIVKNSLELKKSYYSLAKNFREEELKTHFFHFLREKYIILYKDNDEMVMMISKILSVFTTNNEFQSLLLIFLRSLDDILRDQPENLDLKEKLLRNIVKFADKIDPIIYNKDFEGIFSVLLIERLKQLEYYDQETKDIFFVKVINAFKRSTDRVFCEDIIRICSKFIRLRKITKLINEKSWKIEDFPYIEERVSFELFNYKFKNCKTFWELEDFFHDNKNMLCQLVIKLLKKDENMAFSIFYRNNLKDYPDFFQRHYESFSILKKKTDENNEFFTKILINPLISYDKFEPMETILHKYDNRYEYNDYMTLKDFGIMSCNIHLKDKKEDLLRISPEILKNTILGIDIENSLLTNIPTLLQISTKNKEIYLIDILALNENLELYEFIQNLFKFHIIKVGQGLANDINNIRKINKNLVLIANDLVDIQEIFKKKYPDEKLSSVAFMVEKLKKRKLSKDETMGNWTKRPLRKYQLHYAALDGYLMLELYESLCHDL